MSPAPPHPTIKARQLMTRCYWTAAHMDKGAEVVGAQGKAMADRRRTVRCIKIIQ